MEKDHNALAKAGMALGVGVMAGLVGTAAVTLSKKLDKKNPERKSEKAILEVASKVLDIEPTSEDKEEKVIEEVHWAYGAGMGAARGALYFLGIKGFLGTATHFATIWFTERMALPSMKKIYHDIEGAKPIDEEEKSTIIRESAHQALYAVVTGVVFDLIVPRKKNK